MNAFDLIEKSLSEYSLQTELDQMLIQFLGDQDPVAAADTCAGTGVTEDHDLCQDAEEESWLKSFHINTIMRFARGKFKFDAAIFDDI